MTEFETVNNNYLSKTVFRVRNTRSAKQRCAVFPATNVLAKIKHYGAFPKIIHQIWLQGADNIPSKFLPPMNKIKAYHSTWEYILWDDVAIINLLRKNKVWIETYYKLTYLHQKVDYARYIILYIYGDVYIDIDVIIVKPLDSLVDKYRNYDFIVSKTNLTWLESWIYCGSTICINNGIIIAKPRTTILNKIIGHINSNPTCKFSFIKFFCINNTTGPKMFTNIILDNFNKKIKVLEPEYLEPQVLGTGSITKNTYAIHKHEGSWLNKNLKIVGIYYLKNRNFVPIFLIIFLVVIILFFFKFWKIGVSS